jgi:hypothetical protein
MKSAVHVKVLREMRNAYNILVGKTEEKMPLARSSRRWEDTFKIYLRGVGWAGGCDWINMA